MTTIRRGFQTLQGGASSALVSFPISMTYGVIAFAPFGLEYTAHGILAGLFGAIFSSFLLVPAGGRSMMGVGPRAASIVIFSALCSQLMAHPALILPADEKIQLVIAIGFIAMAMAGLIQVIIGYLRAGTIVNFVPYSVIAGFINASVVLIVIGQVWPLLGLARQPSLFDLVDQVENIAPFAVVPGLGTIALMMLSKRYLKAVPAPLVGLVSGIALYHGLVWMLPGIDLGPTLLPLESWQPSFYIVDQWQTLFSQAMLAEIFWLVIPAAISMAALASFDTIFSLSALSELTGEKTDTNKELTAHGIANLSSSLLGGLISSGGLNRSKPALDIGVRSPVFHAVAAVVMLVALIGASDWVSMVPSSVIGGMVLYIGIGLFDGWTFSQVFSLKRSELARRKDLIFDLVIIMLVIMVTLLQNLIVAVGVGVLVAVFIFVMKISRNLIRSCNRGPTHKSRKAWPESQQEVLRLHGKAIAVLRLQGALFFGTAKSFEEQIDALIADGVKYLVLDMKQTKEIDISGVRALMSVHRNIQKVDGYLALSYIRKERRLGQDSLYLNDRRSINGDRGLWRILESCGTIAKIGLEQFYFDTDSALIACESCLIDSFQPQQHAERTMGWTRNQLIEGLSIAELKSLKPLLHRTQYQAGDQVFQQGDPGDGAYFILRGNIDIMLEIEGGGEKKRLQTYTNGAFFGEMSLLNNMPRSATAIARKDTDCFHLDVQGYQKLNADLPEISIKLVSRLCAILANRLQQANHMIIDLES